MRKAILIENLGVTEGHALYGAQDVAQGSQGCALHACGRFALLHHRLRITWTRAFTIIQASACRKFMTASVIHLQHTGHVCMLTYELS